MSKHAAITPDEAADRLAIRELVEAYAHCADRRDAKGQMSLFTADTHFVVYMDAKDPKPSQDLHTREALAPVFADLNRYAATTHFVGQSTISTLTADRASVGGGLWPQGGDPGPGDQLADGPWGVRARGQGLVKARGHVPGRHLLLLSDRLRPGEGRMSSGTGHRLWGVRRRASDGVALAEMIEDALDDVGLGTARPPRPPNVA